MIKRIEPQHWSFRLGWGVARTWEGADIYSTIMNVFINLSSPLKSELRRSFLDELASFRKNKWQKAK